MKVRDRITGQVGELPDNELQQYAGRYEPIGQSQAQVQPQVQSRQSGLEKVGGVGMNILKGLLEPFISGAKNVASYATDPNAGPLAAGQRAYDLRQKGVPFLQALLQSGVGEDIGRLTKTAFKPAAAAASFAVPFGKGAGLMKGVVPGAISGGLFETGREGATPQSVLGAGMIGGATGGILDKILGPGAGKGLQNVQTDIQKGILAPKIAPSATAAQKEIDLAKRGIDIGREYGFRLDVGSAQARRESSAKLYAAIQDQVNTALSQSTRKLPKTQTLGKLAKEIIKEGDNFVPGSVVQKRILTAEIQKAGKKVSGTTISDQNLSTLKNYLGKKLSKAFGKDVLTEKEGVIMDMWKAVDNLLPDNIKVLTRKQSVLHDLAPGLATQAKQGPSIPILGRVEELGRPMQAMTSGMANIAGGIGKGQEVLAGTLGSVANKLGIPVAILATDKKLSNASAAATFSTDDITKLVKGYDEVSVSTGGMSQDQYQKALMWDMANNNGKDVAQIKTLFEAGQGSADSQKKDRQRAAAGRILDLMEKQYFEGQLAGGRLGGGFGLLTKTAGFNPKLNTYLNTREQVKPTLARAIGEVGNLAQNEQINVVKNLPTAFSTLEEAMQGFAAARVILGLPPSQYSQ